MPALATCTMERAVLMVSLLLFVFHALCTDSAVDSVSREGEKNAAGFSRGDSERAVPASDGRKDTSGERPFVPFLPELSKRCIT